jgi:hypothetical protein
VRIERDEARFPSKGTWPDFRGRVGTVVEINEDHKRPHLTEYGVVFGKVRAKPTTLGSISNGHPVWFKAHEICDVAAERDSERRFSMPKGKGTGDGSDLYSIRGAA